MGRGRDPHKGISGTHARASRLTIGIRPKAIAQEGSIAFIDLVKACDCRSGIREGFRRNALRGQDARCKAHMLNGTPEWACIDADDSNFSNIQPMDLKIETRLVGRLIM